MLPERDPVKKLNKRPDVGSDCKSRIFFLENCWFVYLYNFDKLPSGSEFCYWDLEKFHLYLVIMENLHLWVYEIPVIH